MSVTIDTSALDKTMLSTYVNALRSGDYFQSQGGFIEFRYRKGAFAVIETLHNVVGVSCDIDGVELLQDGQPVDDAVAIDDASEFTKQIEDIYLELPADFEPTFQEFADMLEGSAS